jgi:hypothetical protein
MSTSSWQDKLIFTGFARPAFGSIPQQSEMQARLVVKVLTGEVQLPQKEEMEKQILVNARSELDQHWSAKTTFPLTSFVNYTDSIAQQIGAEVDYTKYLFSDPRLLLRLLCTQYTVVRFYLEDPDPKMRGLARETLMTYPRVPVLFAIDIHNFLVCLLLCKLGMDGVRPMTVRPATWTQMILAWMFLPFWLLLLAPSLYTYCALHVVTLLHPFNLLRYYKIYFKRLKDGEIDMCWATQLLQSPALNYWVWKPASYMHLMLSAVLLLPTLLITKMVFDAAGIPCVSAKFNKVEDWFTTERTTTDKTDAVNKQGMAGKKCTGADLSAPLLPAV